MPPHSAVEEVADHEPPRPYESAPAGEAPPAPVPRPAPYWAAFAACTVAALVPLWSVKYLPMADLPQHAAQISIWMHLRDPSWGFAGQYELNWFTPYLLGYALARGVATFTSIAIALKVVVTAVVVGLPLSMQVLLDRCGGDRFWALLGFPVAFGFAFYWGFLNFLVAVPLGILFVALAYEYANVPTLRGGLAIGAFALFLFFAHALVLGLCCAAAAAIIALRARRLRAFISRTLPLAGAMALALCWAIWTHSRENQTNPSFEWGAGLDRLLHLPLLVVGCRTSPPLPEWLSPETSVVLLMIVAVAATRPRLSRDPARWAPGLLALAGCLLAPTRLAGIASVAERFAIFLVPFVLVAADRAPDVRRALLGRVAVVLVAIGWMIVLTGRFRAFDAEAAGVDVVMARMEPRRSVLGLIFDPTSLAVPGAPHLHMPAWYQAEKGGVLGFSFASFFPELARHAPGASGPLATESLTWSPDLFRWEHDGWYDYFLVRSPVDAGFFLFRHATVPVHLEAQSGMWWLYRVERSR